MQLPRECAVILNGEPHIIRRGATRPVPAFVDVRAYNAKRQVTDAQVDAMLAGVACGWERVTTNSDEGDEFEFIVQLVRRHTVRAPCLDDAIAKVEQDFADEVIDGINFVKRNTNNASSNGTTGGSD